MLRAASIRPAGRLGTRRCMEGLMDQELIEQILRARAQALDAARPEAVAATHASGRFTARERIEALLDPGTFVEYGILAEAQPDAPGEGAADGLVGGAGRIDGHPVAAASYDETVHDGTQSDRNQRKLTRLLYLANAHRWPFVCFADGGGARPVEERPAADDPHHEAWREGVVSIWPGPWSGR